MRKVISIILFIIALLELVKLSAIVGVCHTIIFALCSCYMFNYLCSVIVEASDKSKEKNVTDTEQI